ncbi:MAG: metal ABC transporter permease [Eubacteriales bacterium]|nr:metal ABC transporter permease [Eubacteriales bacterium]
MTISEIFGDPIIRGIVFRALTVGILVSLCAAVLGVSLVLRRYSMIGDGLSHVGFFALSIAAALGLDASNSLEISIPIVIAAAFLLMKLTETGVMRGDAATAVVSTGAVAVGVVIFSFARGSMTADVCNSLFGSASVITLTDKDLYLSIGISVLVIVLYLVFYHLIFAVTFDEAFARASGARTGFCNLLIAMLTAVVIVVGMKLIGAIMISALVVFPALTAMRVSGSFRRVISVAAVVSCACFVIGFFAGCLLGLPTGPCVVIANLLVYLLCFVVRKAKS